MTEVDTTAANATENVNTNTEAQPQAESPAEQNTLGLTAEQAEEFKKFLDANGGYGKVFDKVKSAVTAREADKKEEPKEQPEQKTEQPATQAQPAPAEQEPKMADGFVSPQEFAIKQYFKAVAAEEKYAPIAKDIESGKILKEMEGLGIKPTDAQGNYNDAMIHRFLDLKAQTVPATATTVEPTTTPTVTYTDTEGEVTSMEQALKIMAENRNGLAKGASEHPNLEAAKKFLGEKISGKK